MGVRKYYNYTIQDLVEKEPDQVAIPVQMHIGAPAQPVVVVGDRVCAGDLIAQPKEGALGARIHASISGRVQQVGTRIVIGKE